MLEGSVNSQRREPVPQEYYVLLCSRRYSETIRTLASAVTDDKRRKTKELLSQIREGGIIEYRQERERRERPFPNDFRKALIEKDGSIISRSISREEAEMLRYSCAIPPFASLENLSATEMLGLADMFEGWAQSGCTNPINMARLLGWADGFRSLVAEVGADYIPPEPPAEVPKSLLKFIASKMFE
jgi:hypothetical protein